VARGGWACGPAASAPARRVWYHRGVGVERINPGGLAPASGFSHAVTASGGRLIFLAGQTAAGPDGRVDGAGVVPQFERALGNLLLALREAGGAPGDLVSLTLYLVDLDDYRAHAREAGEVWRRLAGRDYPAMAAIGVQRLWDAEALVEVQGIAVAGAEGTGLGWPGGVQRPWDLERPRDVSVNP
jgi:enamine deaminase RidA (YjgF/YER057c/UK114 family)